MSELMRPILDQISKLWAAVDSKPTVIRGFVASVSPVLVLLDGASDPVPAQNSAGLLVEGARVVCVVQSRRVIIITADSGSYVGQWVTDPAGVFTAATGWDVAGFRGLRVPGGVSVYVRVTRTGANLNVGVSGDITNVVWGTFAAGWTPSADQPVSSSHPGRVVTGFISTAGNLTAAAVGGSSNIATGEALSLGGTIWV